MFSYTTLGAVHGDIAFFDRAEKIAFNAMPAAWASPRGGDMWAHPYLQAVNEVNAIKADPHAWKADGPMSETYGLEPNYGCCTANFNQVGLEGEAARQATGAQRQRPGNGRLALSFLPCCSAAVTRLPVIVPRAVTRARDGQGWPKLIKQVVMATPDKGAAVTLLLPSTSTLADGSTIKVNTAFPFEDTVKVGSGFGRILALYYRSSTLHHIG
jgi:hypothetical protein